MWLKFRLWPISLAFLGALFAHGAFAAAPMPSVTPAALAGQLEVGDLVFIRVSALPFRKVAETTGSWTNHVGIVVATDGAEPIVAESTFPFSKRGGLAHFLGRSEGGRVEISRLNAPLSPAQQQTLTLAAQKRMGIFYDTGFDLHSRRQFCSRFVHEVVQEATGIQVGRVETFGDMLAQNSETSLGFWRLWYFGRIPWQRETVTPASVLNSAQLHAIFDGYVTPDTHSG
jgi:hypothetical protein